MHYAYFAQKQNRFDDAIVAYRNVLPLLTEPAKIATVLNVTALQVAAGIGWVEGITTEWSERDNVEAVKLLLDLGLDPNVQSDTGRVALHVRWGRRAS